MRLAIATALALATAPLLAQAPKVPGMADKSQVTAGTYAADPDHTQVTWQVNHMGFSFLQGQIGATSGSLTIDPAKPAATKVDITFATDKLSTTSAHLTTHLMSKDFFESTTYPTAHFVSTSVTVNGNKAVVVGNLTIKNITKPVTLDVTFVGTGVNPMSKKANIGFRATTSVNRSEFGLGMAVPLVSDKVDLAINAAFLAS